MKMIRVLTATLVLICVAGSLSAAPKVSAKYIPTDPTDVNWGSYNGHGGYGHHDGYHYGNHGGYHYGGHGGTHWSPGSGWHSGYHYGGHSGNHYGGHSGDHYGPYYPGDGHGHGGWGHGYSNGGMDGPWGPWSNKPKKDPTAVSGGK